MSSTRSCCRAGSVVDADRARRRTLTSWPSVRTDIRNAGGTWIDEQVKVCTAGPNLLLSSRKPEDLPAFNAKLVEVVSAAERRPPAA